MTWLAGWNTVGDPPEAEPTEHETRSLAVACLHRMLRDELASHIRGTGDADTLEKMEKFVEKVKDLQAAVSQLELSGDRAVCNDTEYWVEEKKENVLERTAQVTLNLEEVGVLIHRIVEDKSYRNYILGTKSEENSFLDRMVQLHAKLDRAHQEITRF